MRALALSLTMAVACSLAFSGTTAAMEGANKEAAGEYVDIASRIADTFRTRNGDALTDMINVAQVVDISVRGLDFDKNDKAEMVETFEGIKGEIAKALFALVPQNAHVKVLSNRPHEVGGQALIRTDMGDHGYSYRNYYLSKDEKGALRIVDWYDYSTGQLYTDTMRQSLGSGMPSKNAYKRLFNTVTGDKTRRQYSGLLTAIAKNDAQAFFKLFDAADDSVRTSRLALILAFRMSSVQSDSSRYADVLSLLAKHHGDDESLQLILIDHYLFVKQYDRAVIALENIANHMGVRDAANYALTAALHNEAGETDKAIQAGEKAVSVEAELELSYWTLLTSYVKAKRFDDAVNIINALNNNFDYLIDGKALAADPTLSELLNSEAFKRWQTPPQ